MMPIDITALAQRCAPSVQLETLKALVQTESGFNPFAIGIVGGHLIRQPRNLKEAVLSAKALEAQGWNYSLGLGQINRTNLYKNGLDTASAFEACANLRAAAAILTSCYQTAALKAGDSQFALRQAFSCYYAGNFTRGFALDANGSSYVQRVVSSGFSTAPGDPTADTSNADVARAIPIVPGIDSTRIQSKPEAGSVSNEKAANVAPKRSGVAGALGAPRRDWDAFGDF